MTTVILISEESLGADWSFDSALAALKTPIASPSRQLIASEFSRKETPLQSDPYAQLSRALSQDDEETPKATPSVEDATALGDFGSVFRYLGYAVKTAGPITPPRSPGPLIEPDAIPILADDTPTKPQSKRTRSVEDKATPQAIKVFAQRAETGRRAVLDNYLGSSPEDGIKQVTKTPKLSKWLQNGLTPSSISPQVTKISRKQPVYDTVIKNKLELILELHQRFPESSGSLASTTSSILETDPTGVHVFVDISNILIGFHDALKAKHGINRNQRIKRQTLSFHNLSIILERGRSAAKRWLAGSDDIDCIQEARSMGYTAHILQRVDKPDYSTPGTRNKKKTGLTSSDTDSGTPGRMRRAEQAVDEIIHLGMMQSIVDSERPSTIILASGDAAKAEFSDGFLANVERALNKGWKVEVIAFRSTVGYGYRDKAWMARWGDSFKLILLDDFAELLHVPYEGSRI